MTNAGGGRGGGGGGGEGGACYIVRPSHVVLFVKVLRNQSHPEFTLYFEYIL